MIRLGFRLTLSGGREAITRLALIAVAVAIGVGLLLSTLAGLNAVNSQNDRYAWLETGYAGSDAPASRGTGTADPLWWQLRADYFSGSLIGRVDLAATGPHSPVPPGIPRLPAAGEYYASPALAAWLHRTPAAQLGDRYPGREVGTIGAAALPSPDSLVIVIGHRVADLAHQRGADEVTAISTTVPSSCDGGCAVGVGQNSNSITLILSVVTAALLFPVLVFIGGATRLSAARREQRFAAMRLVGATPRQISVIATVESAFATVLGVLGGFGLFYAFRAEVARIPFTGERFFTSDLALSGLDVGVVAVGVPVAAAVAARLALRRVTISPLGVTRRVTPRPPRVWRIVPLLAGIGELGYFAFVRDIGAHTGTAPGIEALAFVTGVVLVMIGLVTLGPWLTLLSARVVARRANRPAGLLAARRLADNPQAGFRAITGLVLAVFVGTCAIGIITSIAANNGGSDGITGTDADTLFDAFDPMQPTQPTLSVTAATTQRLRSIPGVTGVALIRDRPVPGAQRPPGVDPRFGPIEQLVSCADFAGVPALGHCPAGASAVLITPNYGGGLDGSSPMPTTTWPTADISTTQLQQLRIDTVVVGTDGSRGAIEQARTALDLGFPNTFAPETIGETHADQSRLLDAYRQLANVVILTSLPIAGCSLAVSVAGGLADRKRPFSLLRLAGTPLRTLRNVVGFETVAPLVITAAGAVGAGFLAAYLFLRAQLRESLEAPGLEYYLIVCAGLLASLAVIATTLPLLNRLTGPETARND